MIFLSLKQTSHFWSFFDRKREEREIGIFFFFILFLCNVFLFTQAQASPVLLATRSGSFDQFGSRDWSQKMAKYRAVYMSDKKPAKVKKQSIKSPMNQQSQLESTEQRSPAVENNFKESNQQEQ